MRQTGGGGPELRGLDPEIQSATKLYNFCRRYFEAVGATFLPSQPDTLRVRISRDIDKELTDRPFYWMWVDAMNETPPDTVLHLLFRDGSNDPSPPARASAATGAGTSETGGRGPHAVPGETRPEVLSPGCHRLLRIYASARQRGMFGVAYEKAKLLRPYVIFIVKISYIADRRRDFLESFAIDPEDYTVHRDAMAQLSGMQLEDQLPRGAKISGIALDMDRIFRVLHGHIAARVKSDDHRWARDAKKRLESELQALDGYYAESAELPQPGREHPEGTESRAAERELKRAELSWRMEPRVEVRPTQMALVYLASGQTSSSSIWLNRKSSPSR